MPIQCCICRRLSSDARRDVLRLSPKRDKNDSYAPITIHIKTYNTPDTVFSLDAQAIMMCAELIADYWLAAEAVRATQTANQR